MSSASHTGDAARANAAGRSYGGESREDRTARRRRQLLDAGLEVFGTIGYAKATVRSLCSLAHVADRYFYQEFAGTEELLLAVYDECLDTLEAAVLTSVAAVGDGADAVAVATAGIEAFLACTQGDPRLARVVWFEVLGVSPRIEAAYMTRTKDFADLLVRLINENDLGGRAGGEAPAVIAYALAGGISQVVLKWVYDDFDLAPDELVAPLVSLLVAGAGLRADGDRRRGSLG